MRLVASILVCLVLVGCAQNFPKPANACCFDGVSGNEVFEKTFERHGGHYLDTLKDLSFDIDGEWKYLITRIQPLVTDSGYRVTSREIVFPELRTYHASFDGPLGNKWVLRAPDSTNVYYNGEAIDDIDVLQSTALTADSFYIFSLGPMGVSQLAGKFERLPNAVDRGREYYRIYAEMVPGIGESERDEIVLWIDPETWLTWRVHITLEGYITTQGAHVDVTFKDYVQRDKFIFPSSFFERVLGPIGIDAHEWRSTNHSINQGLSPETIEPPVQ